MLKLQVVKLGLVLGMFGSVQAALLPYEAENHVAVPNDQVLVSQAQIEAKARFITEYVLFDIIKSWFLIYRPFSEIPSLENGFERATGEMFAQMFPKPDPIILQTDTGRAIKRVRDEVKEILLQMNNVLFQSTYLHLVQNQHNLNNDAFLIAMAEILAQRFVNKVIVSGGTITIVE